MLWGLARRTGICAALLLCAGVATATETITYTYDARGQIIAVDRSGTVNDGQSVDITYDDAGNRTNYTSAGAVTTADLAIDDATVTEGGELVFTVTRSGITTSAVSADYATSDGTALAGTDYTAASGAVSFAANETSKTITVTTTDDGDVESAKTLTVTLSNASSGAALIDNSATGTIEDNDTPPTLSVADASATEGGDLVFTVSLSQASAGTVTVDYATSDDTATAGSDYTGASGTLTFDPNDLSKTITLATSDDSAVEAAETLSLTLSSPSGATIADGLAAGTINDNDVASAELTIGDATVTEGGALSFTVTRSGSTNTAVSAHYATASGTATSGSDFTAKSGTVSFAANDTSEVITVNTTDDSSVEAAETMTVALSSPSSGATIVGATGTGTINDNDVAPAFSVADASANEGSSLSFTVSVGAHSGSVSVTAATSNGTATAPADYSSKSQTLTFTSSQTSKTFSVSTATDSVSEGSETMNVTLSNPSSGTTIADGSAVGTISNVTPPAKLAIGNASVTEGGTLSFTVTRSGTTTTSVSAHYATASGTATSGSDFTAKSGTVSFAANQTSKTITVSTINDSVVESTETMAVTLSSPTGLTTITTATGQGTILDNDTVWTSSMGSGYSQNCSNWPYDCQTYTGYFSGWIGSLSNTSYNGHTVKYLYTYISDYEGYVYLVMENTGGAPPNSGWTSITVPGLGTLTRSSATYTTGGNQATWRWTTNDEISSGTVTIQ